MQVLGVRLANPLCLYSISWYWWAGIWRITCSLNKACCKAACRSAHPAHIPCTALLLLWPRETTGPPSFLNTHFYTYSSLWCVSRELLLKFSVSTALFVSVSNTVYPSPFLWSFRSCCFSSYMFSLHTFQSSRFSCSWFSLIIQIPHGIFLNMKCHLGYPKSEVRSYLRIKEKRRSDIL